MTEELPEWVTAELADLGVDGDDAADDAGAPAPVVAVVGRPNVGKSTLVNRILGRRAAVVQDVPGVTRDRVTYDAAWNGRRFTLMDTGGWEPDAAGLQAAVALQAEHAMHNADVVLYVVDSAVGGTTADEQAVRVLRKAKTPVLLVANKVDDERGEADAAGLWSLGLGEPHPVVRCMGAVAAICSTRCSTRCRTRRASRTANSAARAGWRSSGGRTSASRLC